MIVRAAVAFTLVLAGAVLAETSGGGAEMGAAGFEASAARPMGFRGDGSGKYPGANPPTTWERRVVTPLREFTCQAGKPKGDGPGGVALEARNARFTPNRWLVLGPVTVAEGIKPVEQDVLAGEADLAPDEGDKVGELAWKAVEAARFDFLKLFEKPEAKVAYAVTYFYSPTDMTMGIRLGGQCLGYRYYLNGKNQTDWDLKQRPVNKGWNRLVLKVVQRPKDKEWNFGVHFYPQAQKGQALAYESKNIRWMTPLPGTSFAMPVMVGGRLYFMSEPNDLVCADKDSGQLLWMRSNPVAWDVLGAKPAAREPLEAVAVEKIRAGVGQLEDLNAAYLKGRDPKINETRVKLARQLTDDARKVSKSYHVGMGWGGGNGTATPCMDGQSIWAWYGETGMLSRFDLEGKRIYTRFHSPGEGTEHGYNSSPVLCGDKIVVIGGHVWICFDKNTGEELWRSKYRFPCYPTQVGAKIGGADVMVGADGSVIRVADGKEISPAFGNYDGECASPVIEGDTFYLVARRGFCAAKLPVDTEVRSKPTTIVKALAPELFGAREIYAVGSPVVHEGLVYVTNSAWGAGGEGRFFAVDPVEGKVLYQEHTGLAPEAFYSPQGAGIAASVALGGKNLYVMDNRGSTVVVEPGKTYKQIALNVLENLDGSGSQEVTESTPVFSGGRMYYRAAGTLYCVGEK